MAEYDERPVWSMSGSEMLSALDQLQTALARLQTRRLELLAALEANGHAAELGARDTAELIALRHRLDTVEVRRDLRLATALPKYPDVQQALTATLHPTQAEVIVTTLERIPATATVPVADLRIAEQQMVKAAELLAPGELRKLGSRVRNTLDTDGPEPAEDRALAAETLALRPDDHGVAFKGYLAGAHAELLQTLILAGAKPHLTPEGHRDPRSSGKRRADALTSILEVAAATGGAAPAHGDIKPHVTVTIDLADLQSSTGTGTSASGAVLSAAAVRRLACDAGVIPLVLGSNSEPLDVGTEHRFVTRAIRQALNARDQGCVICAAPPPLCDAHHITHWADGGPTNLTNLALLCKPHHQAVHQGHWTLTIHNGHPQVSTPTWATPNSSKDPPTAA
ncbi:DUF222 domain-containing protein [Kribbella sp. NPDC051770]|uniref:HNH endonuclease signature motif containing protein n=1 Tax=Kribbella sp. NPDC051770 TaxID=3155413 RepID=UPI003443D358